jgi:hypothetical protein
MLRHVREKIMKIRKGFISNSSSCSFTCVIDEEEYNKVLESLSKKIREIIELGGSPEEKEFANRNLLLITGEFRDNLILNETDLYYEKQVGIHDANEAWFVFTKKLKENSIFYKEEGN